MSTTPRLARYVADQPRDWAPEVRHAAARAFVDTIACMVAGGGEPSTGLAFGAVARWGQGGASVAGRGSGLPAPWAAMVNGVAAHALDYDDVLEPALSHVSAVLVPAILALGEERDLGGAAALDAYIVGFEVMTLLAEAMNLGHYADGWHTTVTMGAPASAAACARLLGLDRARAGAALAMATSLCAGSRAHMGTMTKHLHAGFAAKAGVMAATFAEAGMTAAEEAYEGAWGFETLFGGPGARPLASVLHTLDGPPAIARHGVWVKPYPCCASAHRPIDAARALRDEDGVRPEEVEQIRVTLPMIAHRNLMYPQPRIPSEARFSLQHCVAVALATGAAGPEAFAPGTVADPTIAALRGRIEADPDQSRPGTAASGAASDGVRLEARLQGGRVVVQEVEWPRGHPKRPLSDEELRAKFEECARGVLSQAATGVLLEACFGLDRLARMRDLARLLRG